MSKTAREVKATILCPFCSAPWSDENLNVWDVDSADQCSSGRFEAPTYNISIRCHSCMRKNGDSRDWPFRRIHFRDSTDCYPLQLVDIFIGALAFHLNGHAKLPTASPAKMELSNYILKRAVIDDVTRDTQRAGRFTIWHRQLR